MRSALNLIVFGPKLEHLDLIEYVIVDLLNVKYKTFIKKIFFKRFAVFMVFFFISLFVFVTRPSHLEGNYECGLNGTKVSCLAIWKQLVNDHWP